MTAADEAVWREYEALVIGNAAAVRGLGYITPSQEVGVIRVLTEGADQDVDEAFEAIFGELAWGESGDSGWWAMLRAGVRAVQLLRTALEHGLIGPDWVAAETAMRQYIAHWREISAHALGETSEALEAHEYAGGVVHDQ